MVVGILKAHLYRVVVHVADRQLGAHPLQAQGLELQVGHGACGVLGEGLIDADAYLGAGDPPPHHQVAFQDLLRYALAHLRALL